MRTILKPGDPLLMCGEMVNVESVTPELITVRAGHNSELDAWPANKRPYHAWHLNNWGPEEHARIRVLHTGEQPEPVREFKSHTEMLFALRDLATKCREQGPPWVAEAILQATAGWLPVEREVRVVDKSHMGVFCQELDRNDGWNWKPTAETYDMTPKDDEWQDALQDVIDKLTDGE